MESLRAQLAETQGALTDRDKKFRQLRAEHVQTSKSWLEEKSTLEAKIARLESENLRLKGAPLAATGNTINLLKLNDQQDVDEGDKITISRSRMKQAEAQFESLANELTEKTKSVEALEAKLARLSPTPALTDDQIVTQWNQLRVQVRTLSLERLNQPFSVDLVSDRSEAEFNALSPRWKSYATTSNVTYYLFRGLIWRYLLRYFRTPCRACGRDVSDKVRELADALSKNGSDAEYQDWRIRTATLAHKVYPVDKGFVNEVATQIAGAITPLVVYLDADALKILKTSLRSIVTAAAELSVAIDQSHFVVLMSDKPGSTLTHGFPYVETLMDIRAKFSTQGVVDLMITPSLLKKETEYSVVVKAEVTC